MIHSPSGLVSRARACAALALAWVALAAPAMADQLSDLAGTWKKDMKLSDPPVQGENPESDLTLTVAGNKATIDQVVHFKAGDLKFQYSYLVDGQTHKVATPFTQGAERDFTVNWKGDEMVVTTTLTMSVGTANLTERWKLKGKDKLEIKRTFETAVANRSTKTIYRRN
jgi:hypothetical protein